jgi:aldehyde:ferredoxin oxidoreductase
MAERYGYWNKILHVDLTRRKTWVEEPGDRFFRMTGGGRGIIAHYLLKEVPDGADPLGPDNVLVFAPGVVTGVPIPGAGRHSVGAKSPLTGGFGEAESGGFWGAELKRAGWDAIVVHGASASPVYVWINQDKVEIRDASRLWGKFTGDAEDDLLNELGDPRIRVTQIGPAGENLVRFACVTNDLNEVAGRTGLGAVMGSKKLKAIAVRGKTPVPVADQPALLGIAKWISATMDENPNHHALHEFGTGAGTLLSKNLEGGLPTSNFRYGSFDDLGEQDAVAVRDQVRIDMEGCYACSIRCKKIVQIEAKAENAGVTKKGVQIAVDPKGRWSVDPRYGGPEYESLASLGTNVEVNDLIAICKSNEMCNYLGMDAISAGATLAWAMECYEKGVITDADTGGIPLRFRDAEGLVDWIERMAYRLGFGDLLAEGSQRAAAKIGKGSEDFLTTVKGLELAMHDPRHVSLGRDGSDTRTSYMTAPTGGDHTSGNAPRNGLRNQTGLCIFLGYSNEQTLEIIKAVTGWDITPEEMVETAHRGVTMARLFNERQGFSRMDDALPKRFAEDLPKRPGLSPAKQDELVTEYYKQLGWNEETGRPTPATISRLQLAEYAETRGQS